MPFRLLPNQRHWMTLNGCTALYWTNDAFFGAHHGNLKTNDRSILLAAKKCSPVTLTFRRYKVIADIRGGFVARKPQTTVRRPEPAIFTSAQQHAMQMPCLSYRKGVRLSVCLSVTP